MTLVLLFLAALAASTISGIVGMAGGVTLLAAMTIMMPWPIVVPIHGIVQLASNMTRALILFKNVHRPSTFGFLLGLPLGGSVAYWILKGMEAADWVLWFVVLTILYVVFRPKRLPEIKLSPKGFFVLGAVASCLGAFLGATGPLMAPFYVRSDMDKKQIVATKAACQLGVHLTKVPIFLGLSFAYQEHYEAILVMIVGVVLGTLLGTFLLGKVSQELFLKLAKAALLVVAFGLVYRKLL